MSSLPQDERAAAIATIKDLLTIARVAMPDDLFETDPRVIKAQALLARLSGEAH